MNHGFGNLAHVDAREAPREEVHYRARGFGPNAEALNLLVVNISAHGMMARCEGSFAVGERIRVTLPVVGVMVAEVRWSLGGRIGCQFETMVDLASYYELLTVLVKGK